MVISGNDARSNHIVFAWAFARFLQSTPGRLLAFNELCQATDSSNQVPDTAEIAKLYGFPNAAALEKAWIEWMVSALFR